MRQNCYQVGSIASLPIYLSHLPVSALAMGGGHHHHERLQIPDWKIYQVGDHTPNLQQLQQRLAAKGLKDPWIRNEVWRFDTRMHGTFTSRKFAAIGFRPRAMIGGINLFRASFVSYSNKASLTFEPKAYRTRLMIILQRVTFTSYSKSYSFKEHRL